MTFGKDFVWGVATAATQIEGGWDEDGKGKTIWDETCLRGGKIFNSDNCFTACDHYHRWKEDVALMKKLHIKAYRFSISWTRLFPNGDGELNLKGAQFYSDLIDELINSGIEPYITLHHWDYPLSLYEQGGWFNKDNINKFVKFASKVVELYSDRVEKFYTFNEAECICQCGYYYGEQAPYEKRDFADILKLGHNLLIANGLAIKEMRRVEKQKIKIGYAVASNISAPKEEKDIVDAEKMTFVADYKTLFQNSWFLDAMVKGEYNVEQSKIFENLGVKFTYPKEDMELIKCELDFIGINIYTAKLVSGGKKASYSKNMRYSTMNWAFVPECMYYATKFFYNRYHLPLYISENGLSLPDIKTSNEINDEERITYLTEYLAYLAKAKEEGCPILGYFYWSFCDNFEWTFGFSKRFGLINIDFETQERTCKNSALFYKQIIDSNGENILGK